MIDFKAIRQRCETVTDLTPALIDDFILHYAAMKDNLARAFDVRMERYKHIGKANPAWVRMLKSQYIIHRVFCKDGLLRKYLNHVEVKKRSSTEIEYLEQQLQEPWRFSFSVLTGNPDSDFYEMEDVFTGESFLLYSKSVTKILTEQPAMLWFNLIAFNGSCWQTFGPLSAYQSFDPDDIYFFATEVNPNIDSEEALMLDVEKNPLPYMMLLHGAQIPVTINKDEEVVLLCSEEDLSAINTEKLKGTFKVEYSKGVYRLRLTNFEIFPNLASAYFDENNSRLFITAMTERGFNAVAEALNTYGVNISDDPNVRIHPSMIVTIEEVLKRNIEFDPYEKLFPKTPTPGQEEENNRLNHFLSLIISILNDGGTPDVEKLAKEAGIDMIVANDLLSIAKNQLRDIRP